MNFILIKKGNPKHSKYGSQDDYKIRNENSIHVTDILIKFLLEKLHIKFEDFECLLRKYVDCDLDEYEFNSDDEGYDDFSMATYNFAKIISIYIYIKFVINNITSIFDNIKQELFYKIQKISIYNLNDIFMNIDKNKKKLNLIQNLIFYLKNENINEIKNIDLNMPVEFIENNILKDLLLIYYCIHDFTTVHKI